jgi:hypothetical protein
MGRHAPDHARRYTRPGLPGSPYDGGIPNEVVHVLAAQHLIRPEVRSGSRWYELTHDRFIRPIQKSNLEWKSQQWSLSSFEERYTAAIRRAVGEAGVLETNLRRFLDSMVSPLGTRLARAAESAPEPALEVLVQSGLLCQATQGTQRIYTPLNDEIALAIQLANQNWQAVNWPGARNLRKLERRAQGWVRAGSTEHALLLARAQL